MADIPPTLLPVGRRMGKFMSEYENGSDAHMGKFMSEYEDGSDAHRHALKLDGLRAASSSPHVFETRTMPRAPPHRKVDLDVTLRDAEPVYRRPYPVAAHHMQELNRQIKVLLDAGIIRSSASAYGAPVLFAPKADGKLRLCVDYRALNAKTVRDRERVRRAPASAQTRWSTSGLFVAPSIGYAPPACFA